MLAVALGCGSELLSSDTILPLFLGALHVQQGAHAAGASAGRGRLLHPVLHRHHLRPSGLFHHQGALLFLCVMCPNAHVMSHTHISTISYRGPCGCGPYLSSENVITILVPASCLVLVVEAT